MRPGDMRWRLTILRRVQTGTNELNEPVFDYQPIRTVRAQKIHKTEDEAFAAQQTYAARVVTFRTYYQADLTETNRLRSDGTDYNIVGFRELGRRSGLEIQAVWPSSG